jgi:ribosomal protein L7/L12
MRTAILDANGPSALGLAAGSATPAAVMQALRKVRTLSLTEARAMAEELCSRGLEGTRVEMEVLAIALRAAGAIVSIRSSDAV